VDGREAEGSMKGDEEEEYDKEEGGHMEEE